MKGWVLATDFKENLLNSSVAQLTHRMKTKEKAAESWSSNSEWLVALTISVQLEVVRKL